MQFSTQKSGVSFVGYSNPIRTLRMVPVVGLEPTRSRPRRILNPLRLPIPSHRPISIPSSACRSVPRDKPSSAPSSKSRLREDIGRSRRSAYPGPFERPKCSQRAASAGGAAPASIPADLSTPISSWLLYKLSPKNSRGTFRYPRKTCRMILPLSGRCLEDLLLPTIL